MMGRQLPRACMLTTSQLFARYASALFLVVNHRTGSGTCLYRRIARSTISCRTSMKVSTISFDGMLDNNTVCELQRAFLCPSIQHERVSAAHHHCDGVFYICRTAKRAVGWPGCDDVCLLRLLSVSFMRDELHWSTGGCTALFAIHYAESWRGIFFCEVSKQECLAHLSISRMLKVTRV